MKSRNEKRQSLQGCTEPPTPDDHRIASAVEQAALNAKLHFLRSAQEPRRQPHSWQCFIGTEKGYDGLAAPTVPGGLRREVWPLIPLVLWNSAAKSHTRPHLALSNGARLVATLLAFNDNTFLESQ